MYFPCYSKNTLTFWLEVLVIKRLNGAALLLVLSIPFFTSCGGNTSDHIPSPLVLELATSQLGGEPEGDTTTIMVEPTCEDFRSETIVTADQIEVQASIKRCAVKHNDLDRLFYIFIPETYRSSTVYQPLLFSLHGYTSSAILNMRYTGVKKIASEEGFIAVFPQGSILRSTGATHWNVGGWTLGSTADDLKFVESLIDFMTMRYRLDPSRIYSTGMSNGGFMSYHLACHLGEKIAAVASVTGSMTPETFRSCEPVRPIPVLQIHGRQDETVPYQGNSNMKGIDEVMKYWKDSNRCNDMPEVRILPDLTDDGLGGTFTTYADCQNDVEVTLYLLDGLAHRWPLQNEADLDAPTTIWHFLSRYNLSLIHI